MIRSPLTQTQIDCLAAIRELTNGDLPPTYRELATRLGVSVGNVHRLLHSLKERRRVTFAYGRHRTLAILDDGVARLTDYDLKAADTGALLSLAARATAIASARGAP